MANKLSHYLRVWELSDPQPLTETATSRVYTVNARGTRVVLKLLTPIGIQDEKNGAVALRYWGGSGAVRLLRADDDAHLLEYASGEDLVGMVKAGGDEEAAAIIADVLNQLHAATAQLPNAGLTPLSLWSRSLFKKAALDRQAGVESIYTRAAQIAEEHFAHPRDVRVLHGDIHHENIRFHSQRGWLAFDPKGLVGERTYDAANTLCNPMNMPELVENEERVLKIAAILARKMGIELPRLLDFVYIYVCLSASWYVEDGIVPDQELKIAEIVEAHIRRD